jgi:Zn-dependent peptidase ImmA (M78 family)
MNKRGIDDIVFDILKRSKALDVFPTPVDKIMEYCELNLNGTNDFHNIPHNYVSKNLDALKRAVRKVLGALDRSEKIIYIDPTLPNVKKNFVKLHEVGHGALPWQKDARYEDDEYTLSPQVKEQFEAEANYFASGALFQLERFEDEMNNLPLEIGSPMALAKKFGGSNHAAIRRYAELSKKRCALLVLEDKQKNGSKSVLDLRNCFQSSAFTKEFGQLNWPAKLDSNFPFIEDYLTERRFHKEGTIQLLTNTGFVEFTYHYFDNRYTVFVLIIPPGETVKSKTKIYVTKLAAAKTNR